MFSAIVIANNHYNALGVIRSLGENNIPVMVILTTLEKTFVEKSRYVNASFHIEEEATILIDKLHDICKDDRKYYIFPTTDFSGEVLDKYYSDFSSNVVLPHMQGHMREAQDKLNIKSIAQKCGLLVPEGTVCDLIDIEMFVESWSKFPVIIKPLISIEGSKSDILIANNPQSLNDALKTFFKKEYSRVLVEEYIAGNDEYMLEVMGYCSVNQNPFVGGIIQKIREFPIRNGSTAYAKVLDDHVGLDKHAINKLLSYYQFTGLFDIEFKFANGKAYFIECNFRNGAPGYALTLAGINLPYLWIMSNETNHVDSIIKIHKSNFYFMCEHIDVVNMLKKHISFNKWIKQYLKSNKIFFQINDIKPSISYYIGFCKYAINKYVRK